MINREAARRYWGGVAPIGSRIEMVSDHSEHSDHDERAMVEIVGVVEDVKTSELTDPMAPRIYRPLAQRPDRAVAFAVRTDGDPAQLGQPVRAAIRSADADLAVSRIQPLTALLFDTFREDRVLLGMFVAFALVALLMSGAGLYGVTAYAVSQRTQEIGIRMALGATAGDVLRMIGAQNARLVGVGAILGRARRPRARLTHARHLVRGRSGRPGDVRRRPRDSDRSRAARELSARAKCDQGRSAGVPAD